MTAALEPGATVALDDGQAHYLLHVLRAKAGDRVLLFNGRDGEWLAEIASAAKRGVMLMRWTQTLPQARRSRISGWSFAPVKKTPSDYLAQKATELGVGKAAARLHPPHHRERGSMKSGCWPMPWKRRNNRGG